MAGAIETSYFSDRARKDLLQLLQSVPGKKNLVLERSLVGSIELLVNISTLREHGVDRIFFLENDNADSSQRNVLFLARSEKPKTVQAIAAQIKRIQENSSSGHEFSVFWVPRRTLLSEKVLEEAGVLGEVTTGEYELYFQSLAQDILSLELDDAFADLYLRKDPTPLHAAATALMTLQTRHGLFPRILAKGDYAARLADLLVRMRSERAAHPPPNASGIPTTAEMPSPTIDNLIIIDRSIDFASPLLTQLTYEGLIDECFSVSHNQIELDPSIVGLAAPPQQSPQHQQQTPQSNGAAAPPQPSLRKIRLDQSDPLHPSLRDANFSLVGQLLNRVARRLQSQSDRTRLTGKTTSELRDFVAKLPGYQAEQQSLKVHTGLAEELVKRTRGSETFRRCLELQQGIAWGGITPAEVLEGIEDVACKSVGASTAESTECLTQILRLACLYALFDSGIRRADLDSLRRIVTHTFGHAHLLTLDALEKMGLLPVKSSSNPLAAFTTTTAAGTTSTPAATSIAKSAISSTTTSPGPQATSYAPLRTPLSLTVDDVSEDAPSDPSYIHSGICPLSIRLVQAVLQKGHLLSLRGSASATASTADGKDPFAPFTQLINGQVRGTTAVVQQGTRERAGRARATLEGRGGRKTNVVFFLGGVTFAEVAGLRFVRARMAGGEGDGEGEGQGQVGLCICTTGMISGGRIVKAAVGEDGV